MEAQQFYDKALGKNSSDDVTAAMQKSGKWTPEQLQGVVSVVPPVQASTPVVTAPPVQASVIPIAPQQGRVEQWMLNKFPGQVDRAKYVQQFAGGDYTKAKFLAKTPEAETLGQANRNTATSSTGARGFYQIQPATALGLLKKYHNDPQLPASLKAFIRKDPETGKAFIEGTPDLTNLEVNTWMAAKHYDEAESYTNVLVAGGGDRQEENRWLDTPGQRAIMRHIYYFGGQGAVSRAIGHAGQKYANWLHQNESSPGKDYKKYLDSIAALHEDFSDFPTAGPPVSFVSFSVDADQSAPIPEKEDLPPVEILTPPIEETILPIGINKPVKKAFVGPPNPLQGPPAPTAPRETVLSRLQQRNKERAQEDHYAPARHIVHPFAQFARAFNEMLLIPDMVYASAEPGKSKQVHDWIEKKIQAVDLAPEDTTAVDDVIGALGTMAAFFVPSTGIAKGTVALAQAGPRMAKLATLLSRGGVQVLPAAFMESSAESGRAYQDLLRRNVDPNSARKTAGQLFSVNLMANIALNKLSGIFDALPREVRGGWTNFGQMMGWIKANQGNFKHRGFTAAVEGVQEMQQNLTGALFRGDNPDLPGMFYEGGIGSVAASIFGLRRRGGRPIEEILREGKAAGLLPEGPSESDTDSTGLWEGPLDPNVSLELGEDAAWSSEPKTKTVAPPEVVEKIQSDETAETAAVPAPDEVLIKTTIEEEEPAGVVTREGTATTEGDADLMLDQSVASFKDATWSAWGEHGADWDAPRTPSGDAQRTGAPPVVSGDQAALTRADQARAATLLRNALRINMEGVSNPEDKAEELQRAKNILYTYNSKLGPRGVKRQLDAYLTQTAGWTAGDMEVLGIWSQLDKARPYAYLKDQIAPDVTARGWREVTSKIEDLETDTGADAAPDDPRNARAGEYPDTGVGGPASSPFPNIEGVSEEEARRLGIIQSDVSRERRVPAEGPQSPQGGEQKSELRGEPVDQLRNLIQDLEGKLGPVPSEETRVERSEQHRQPVATKEEYVRGNPAVIAGANPKRAATVTTFEELLPHVGLNKLIAMAGASRVSIADLMLKPIKLRADLDVAAGENIPLPSVRADDPTRYKRSPLSRDTSVEVPFTPIEKDSSPPEGLIHVPVRKSRDLPESVLEGRTSLQSEESMKESRANMFRREAAGRDAKAERLVIPQTALQEAESDAAAVIRERLLKSARARRIFKKETLQSIEAEEARSMQGEGKKDSTDDIPTAWYRVAPTTWHKSESTFQPGADAQSRIPRQPTLIDEPTIYAPTVKKPKTRKIDNLKNVNILLYHTPEATDPEIIALLEEHVALTAQTRTDSERRTELEYKPSLSSEEEKEFDAIMAAQKLSPEVEKKADALVLKIGKLIETNQKFTQGTDKGDSVTLPTDAKRLPVIKKIIAKWSDQYRPKGSTQEGRRLSAQQRYGRDLDKQNKERADAQAAKAAEDIRKIQAEKDPLPVLQSPTAEETDRVLEAVIPKSVFKKLADYDVPAEKKTPSEVKKTPPEVKKTPSEVWLASEVPADSSAFAREATPRTRGVGPGGTEQVVSQPNLAVIAGPSVFHETDLRGLKGLINKTAGRNANVELYVSDDIDLALSQKSGKYVLEFDSTMVNGTKDTSKPGADLVEGSEYVIDKVLLRAVQSITVRGKAGLNALRNINRLGEAFDLDNGIKIGKRIRIYRKAARDAANETQTSDEILVKTTTKKEGATAKTTDVNLGKVPPAMRTAAKDTVKFLDDDVAKADGDVQAFYDSPTVDSKIYPKPETPEARREQIEKIAKL